MTWKPTGMLRDELRRKHPTTALKADHGESHASRIRLHCKECIQHASAANCPDRGCFLFPSRPGADAGGATVRLPSDVPTVAEYETMIRAKDPEGSKGEAARVRINAMWAERGKGKSESVEDEDEYL